MKRIYAVSTRLDMTDELKGYLENYIRFYNSIQRRMFYDLRHDMPKDIGMSRYISHICGTYGILRRTANSIRFNMQGRINAYLALKKTELSQMEAKIQSTRMRISRLEFKVQKLKDLARVNSLDRKKLTDLRNGKASLYYQKNRLNRLVQRKNVLKQQMEQRRL